MMIERVRGFIRAGLQSGLKLRWRAVLLAAAAALIPAAASAQAISAPGLAAPAVVDATSRVAAQSNMA